jgi:hypothetical protein
LNESAEHHQRAFVPDDDTAEVMEPAISTFDFPSPAESTEGSAILQLRAGAVPSMRANQFDTSLPQSRAMDVAVQRPVVEAVSKPY